MEGKSNRELERELGGKGNTGKSEPPNPPPAPPEGSPTKVDITRADNGGKRRSMRKELKQNDSNDGDDEEALRALDGSDGKVKAAVREANV